MRGECRVLVGIPEEKKHFEHPVVGGRIILKRVFEKWDGGTWTGPIWLNRDKVRGIS
jgi:hypothetical protein